jgi:hypothetical protein
MKPDTVSKVFDQLPEFENEKVYFLILSTNDNPKTNVYWLSPKMDVLDWQASNFYQTNCTHWADMTVLQDMPKAQISQKNLKLFSSGGFVEIMNNSSSLGLNIRLRLFPHSGPV